jgi:hypothetical protein
MAVKRTNWAAFLAVLFAACANPHANGAIASCIAQDVLQNNLSHTDALSASRASKVVSAATTPAWKTISLGTLLSNSAVHDAFRSAGCGIGDSAEEMLSQIDFNRNSTKANVDLVALSLAELGFENDEASLTAVYSRALKLGFQLAAPEVGPQLRLQYSNQPLGEFLDIGMVPIKSKEGKSGLFIVANGGAGLLLIGRETDANAEIHAPSRMVFLRPLFSANGHQ